jgi:hypothetical protein
MTYVLIKNTIKRSSFITDKICVFSFCDIKKELYIPETNVTFETKKDVLMYAKCYSLNVITNFSDEKIIYNENTIEYHTKYGCIPDVYYTIEREFCVATENINLKNFIGFNSCLVYYYFIINNNKNNFVRLI